MWFCLWKHDQSWLYSSRGARLSVYFANKAWVHPNFRKIFHECSEWPCSSQPLNMPMLSGNQRMRCESKSCTTPERQSIPAKKHSIRHAPNNAYINQWEASQMLGAIGILLLHTWFLSTPQLRAWILRLPCFSWICWMPRTEIEHKQPCWNWGWCDRKTHKFLQDKCPLLVCGLSWQDFLRVFDCTRNTKVCSIWEPFPQWGLVRMSSKQTSRTVIERWLQKAYLNRTFYRTENQMMQNVCSEASPCVLGGNMSLQCMLRQRCVRCSSW